MVGGRGSGDLCLENIGRATLLPFFWICLGGWGLGLTADVGCLGVAADEGSLAEAALRLASGGFYVLPLKEGSKSPQPWVGGFNGSGDIPMGSCDLDTVGEWWDRDPGSNIGVIPGLSGFIAVDVDGGRGKHTWGMWGLDGSGDQLVVNSPGKGGGLHYWFRLPSDPVFHLRGRVGLGEGVEAIAFGQYIMCPPSRHPSGKTYRVLNGKASVVPSLPGELLVRLANLRSRESYAGVMLDVSDRDFEPFVDSRSRVPSTVKGSRLIRGCYDRLIGTASGDLNQALSQVLGALVGDSEVNLREALYCLWEAWQFSHHGSLSKFEWSRVVRSVCRQPGMDQRVLGSWGHGYGGVADNPFRVRALGDVETRKVYWLLDGWVPLGYCTMLYGDGDKGKSTWSAWLGSQVTRGGDAAVVFTHEEQASTVLAPKWEAAGADMGLVFVPDPGTSRDLSLTDGGVSLRGYLDAIEEMSGAAVRLVVIDPIANYVMGADTHKDSDLRQKVFKSLARIAEERDLAVVYLNHIRKQLSSGVMVSARSGAMGSVAFANVARSVILLGDSPVSNGNGSVDQDMRAIASIQSNLCKKPVPWLFRISEREIRLSDGTTGMFPFMIAGDLVPGVTADDIWRATSTSVLSDIKTGVVENAVLDVLRTEGKLSRMDLVRLVADTVPGVSAYTARNTITAMVREGSVVSRRAGFQGKVVLCLPEPRLTDPDVNGNGERNQL